MLVNLFLLLLTNCARFYFAHAYIEEPKSSCILLPQLTMTAQGDLVEANVRHFNI